MSVIDTYIIDTNQYLLFQFITLLLAASMPLYFQWFQFSKAVGNRIEVNLNDGDMYMMSDKAVGFDWLTRNVPTLRHATGCAKYTIQK
jgi:hypothetical protein